MPLPIGEMDPPNGGDDLRGELAAAFDSAESAAGPDPGGTTAPDPVAAVTAGETEKSPAVSASEAKTDHPNDPARYADGTFKPVKPATAPEKAAAPAIEQASKDDPTKASAQPPTAADAPPAGWTPEAKAEWSNLSPALKAAVIKREDEIANGGRQWSEEKRRMQEDMAPLVMRARELGIDHREGLNRLLSADHMLRTNPLVAIRTLMQTYGVIPENLIGPAPQAHAEGSSGGPQYVQDPRLDSVLQHVEQERAYRAQESAREQARLESLVSEFAASSDHPHFDAVIDHALHLLPAVKAQAPYAGPEKWLQDAYEQAVYANPATRQAMIDSQQKAAEEQRRATAAAQTARAKAAGVSVTGSTGGSPIAAPRDTIREELEAAWAG